MRKKSYNNLTQAIQNARKPRYGLWIFGIVISVLLSLLTGMVLLNFSGWISFDNVTEKGNDKNWIIPESDADNLADEQILQTSNQELELYFSPSIEVNKGDIVRVLAVYLEEGKPISIGKTGTFQLEPTVDSIIISTQKMLVNQYGQVWVDLKVTEDLLEPHIVYVTVKVDSLSKTASIQLIPEKDPIPVLQDNDQDGLLDHQEELIGTDSSQPDTDGDNVGDAEELIVFGTNPLLSNLRDDLTKDPDNLPSVLAFPLAPIDSINGFQVLGVINNAVKIFVLAEETTNNGEKFLIIMITGKMDPSRLSKLEEGEVYGYPFDHEVSAGAKLISAEDESEILTINEGMTGLAQVISEEEDTPFVMVRVFGILQLSSENLP